jgi:hypothetical protein
VSERRCTRESCSKPAIARGLCAAHYQRERRKQDADLPIGFRKKSEFKRVPLFVRAEPDISKWVNAWAKVRKETVYETHLWLLREAKRLIGNPTPPKKRRA